MNTVDGTCRRCGTPMRMSGLLDFICNSCSAKKGDEDKGLNAATIGSDSVQGGESALKGYDVLADARSIVMEYEKRSSR